MDRIPFEQLPMIVKMAVWLVFNNAWWSLEEFVIDRIGLWKYMPYYKVASVCLRLGCRRNYSTGSMARVRRPDAIHGPLMPGRAGCSVPGRQVYSPRGSGWQGLVCDARSKPNRAMPRGELTLV